MRRIVVTLIAAVMLSGCGTVDLASVGKWTIHVAEEACRHVIRDELREIEDADEEPPVNSPESPDTSGGEE